MWKTLQDLRFAVRSMRKHWIVSVVAVVSLSVAIGGNAAVFSMIDPVLNPELPYEAPERLVIVAQAPRERAPGTAFMMNSLPNLEDLQERSRTIEEWGALRSTGVTLRRTDRAVAVSAAEVTGSLFDVLGLRAVRGRTFRPSEVSAGPTSVVVLAHDYWLANFGPETDPVGTMLTIDGRPREVIGVLPENKGLLGSSAQVWIPMEDRASTADRRRRDVITVGRIRQGTTMESVRAEIGSIGDRLSDEHPAAMGDRVLLANNLRTDFPPSQGRILFTLLQGTVVAVLLIACVNMANLLVARGQERSSEIALRTVLGASRGRILRQLVTESGLLTILGAVGGVGLAAVSIEFISRSFGAFLPATYTPELDGRVFAFTAGVSVLAGVTFGLLPILQALRTDQGSALRGGGARTGRSRSRKTFSRGLVVLEVALSFAALAAASMLVRSFSAARASDPGFAEESILTGTVRIPAGEYPDSSSRRAVLEEILERTRAIPGIDAAALVDVLPQTYQGPIDSVRTPGMGPDSRAARVVVIRTSDGYLDVLGQGVQVGRDFSGEDRTRGRGTALVSRSLVRAHFESGNPVGERIEVQGRQWDIVGVVDDVAQVGGPGEQARSVPVVYLPLSSNPVAAPYLAVRARGEPHALVAPIRDGVERIDPDLALGNVMTMEAYVDQLYAGLGVVNTIMGGFGIAALLLAALGTYGVLAYNVNRRTREVGVRLALGARRLDVIRLFAGQGLVLGLLGLGIGVLLSLGILNVMRTGMQGFVGARPSTLVGIGVVLFSAIVAASVLPAARATRVDPTHALNQE